MIRFTSLALAASLTLTPLCLAQEKTFSLGIGSLLPPGENEAALEAGFRFTNPLSDILSLAYEYVYMETRMKGARSSGGSSITGNGSATETLKTQEVVTDRIHSFYIGGAVWSINDLIFQGGLNFALWQGQYMLERDPGPDASLSHSGLKVLARSSIGQSWAVHQNMKLGIDWVTLGTTIFSQIHLGKEKHFRESDAGSPGGLRADPRSAIGDSHSPLEIRFLRVWLVF